MRDRGVILGGLVLFLTLVAFPVWYNRAAGTLATPPQLERPAGASACVAPVEYMRASHMDLLMDWRERVVRRQERTFVAFDGKSYAMSLTRTCLQCHANKAGFCDRCHDYAGVQVACWSCHVDPRLAPRQLARRGAP